MATARIPLKVKIRRLAKASMGVATPVVAFVGVAHIGAKWAKKEIGTWGSIGAAAVGALVGWALLKNNINAWDWVIELAVAIRRIFSSDEGDRPRDSNDKGKPLPKVVVINPDKGGGQQSPPSDTGSGKHVVIDVEPVKPVTATGAATTTSPSYAELPVWQPIEDPAPEALLQAIDGRIIKLGISGIFLGGLGTKGVLLSIPPELGAAQRDPNTNILRIARGPSTNGNGQPYEVTASLRGNGNGTAVKCWMYPPPPLNGEEQHRYQRTMRAWRDDLERGPLARLKKAETDADRAACVEVALTWVEGSITSAPSLGDLDASAKGLLNRAAQELTHELKKTGLSPDEICKLFLDKFNLGFDLSSSTAMPPVEQAMESGDDLWLRHVRELCQRGAPDCLTMGPTTFWHRTEQFQLGLTMRIPGWERLGDYARFEMNRVAPDPDPQVMFVVQGVVDRVKSAVEARSA